jgi:hypothetical protein
MFQSKRLLELLLGAQLVGVAALFLPAVDCAGVEARIAPGKRERNGKEKEKAKGESGVIGNDNDTQRSC